MSNLVIVLGDSGCGKSTSIKGLNSKETVVLNVLGKRLPFKGSNTFYNQDNKNIFAVCDYQTVISYLDNINKNAQHVHNIVIDDAVYIMRTEFFNRAKDRGFEKYNDLADHFRKIIAKCSELRDDINVFMMLHVEPIESEGSIVGYKSSSVGKLLDKMYNPLESVAITLFAQPMYDDKGIPQFGFHTHRKKVNGIEIPAKSPDGMFKEDFIPNDLAYVVKAMNEYYG